MFLKDKVENIKRDIEDYREKEREIYEYQIDPNYKI